MSDQQRSYSISRPPSPPMPSYEPPSASSHSASASSSSRPPTGPSHMAVKRESWRPGQSNSTAPVSAPTGPASSSKSNWRNIGFSSTAAGPSDESRPANQSGYRGGRDGGSKSPVSASSRGYDRDRGRDWDRDLDKRDRYDDAPNDRGSRFGSNGRHPSAAEAAGGNGNAGHGQERSWAAWNKKVEDSSSSSGASRRDNDRGSRAGDRDRDHDRDDDRDRRFGRSRSRSRERNGDRNFDRRRDDRSRDRDNNNRQRDRGGYRDNRRRSPVKKGKDRDEGEGRSWAAWKAKVEDVTTRRERDDERRRSGPGAGAGSGPPTGPSNAGSGLAAGVGDGSSAGKRPQAVDSFPSRSDAYRPPPAKTDQQAHAPQRTPRGRSPPSRGVGDRGRGRRDSPDYGVGSETRFAAGRGRRDSPDYGVGGKTDDGPTRSESPYSNDRKRPPTSPSPTQAKRLRDQSPESPRARRDSPSPPPANRWGRRGRPLSPEPERNLTPPLGPRARPPVAMNSGGPTQPTPKRHSLAPQSEMFMSGPSHNTNTNNGLGAGGRRRSWGRRDRDRDDFGGGPSIDRWGRDERDRDIREREKDRMDIDESPSRRGFNNNRPPSPPQDPSILPYDGQNGHPPLGPRGSMPPFPPSQPPAFTQISKPPPPPSDALPYGSPTQPSSSTLPKTEPVTPANTNGQPGIASASASASGPVKIAFGSTSPAKSRWKSISPNKTAVQHLFDESNPSTRKEILAPTAPALKESGSQPQHSNTYLDRIEASERQYSAHLSSIAPYIKAAFNEWFDQGTSPPLQAFLIHYFGREPSDNELAQIERLLDLRNKTSKDQEEWRGLHEKARASGHRRPEGYGREHEGGDMGHAGVNAIPLPTSRWTPSAGMAPTKPIPTVVNSVTTANDMPTPTSLPSSQHDTSPPYAPRSTVNPLHVEGQISSSSQVTSEAPLIGASSGPAKPRGTYNPSGEMYEKLSHVGEGTYGKVYKARSNDDGSMVALKRIRMEGEKDGFPVTAMREIKLLQGLRHGNVVRLLEIMVSKGSVHMVFEYMDHDLTGLLAHPTLTFSPGNIKSLSHQMLAGLAYLHDRSILHRDMKGSNILLNSRGELKLADFGLARWYSKRHRDDYTNRVITLWYRSPELLMGETVYGPEVDMWSAGCIMLEIFTTKPIFQGSDEINQLEVIYNIMGTPDEAAWPGVKDLPWYELVKPKDVIESKFRTSFAKWLSPAALDLVQGLLAFDPTKRLSAKQAMATPYFASEEPPMEMPSQLSGMGEHHEMSAKADRQRRRQMEGR
ncbi:hypothetical protein IAT40_007978 [Kwoniella sp. CBS 6097]